MLEHEDGMSETDSWASRFSLVLCCHGLEWNKTVNHWNLGFQSIAVDGLFLNSAASRPWSNLLHPSKSALQKVFLELQSILTSNEKYLGSVIMVFFTLYSRANVLGTCFLPLSWSLSCLFALEPTSCKQWIGKILQMLDVNLFFFSMPPVFFSCSKQ